MITIGTVKFDFKANDEPFARSLNTRWDAFFAASFERVAEEVLSAYDLPGRTITIDSLPLDLGRMEPEKFDTQFPRRLREALEAYCRRWLSEGVAHAPQTGIRLATTGQSALELLCFFLMHGYFPMETDAEQQNLSLLLERVLALEAYRFREFLEAHGHYDFICRRLVFQFTDEELERVVDIVHPSESKFINLYVRVQIHAYSVLHRPDISRHDYRNAVWTLVMAYLFAAGGGHFSRKQVVMHTLRGLAAHFNFTLVGITGLLTAHIRQLSRQVGQLPEFWAILEEIRRDLPAGLRALDGTYHTYLLRELLAALRMENAGEYEAAFCLSLKHVSSVLSDTVLCRELLRQLREPEIHRLVGIIVPTEKEYVVSYARLLDKHKETGTFAGKAGEDFRLLKWEFIFAVLLLMPASSFSRKQFVLSVLRRLAAHYNLTVVELLRLLTDEEVRKKGLLAEKLAEVLQLLKEELDPYDAESLFTDPSSGDLPAWVHTPELVRRFLRTHTERQVTDVVARLMPSQARFIVAYASLLDKGRERGMLEGKAGHEFRLLKWEFIFSCIVVGNEVAFHQKSFVYSVLKKLAAHYNQEVTDLLSYFLHQLPGVFETFSSGRLKQILQELYEESVLPLAEAGRVQAFTDKELEQWLVALFGNTAFINGAHEAYLEKWLVYCLEERGELFRTLWREGRLSVPLLLAVVNRTAHLRQLWIHRIGDKRLLAVYRRWQVLYAALIARFRDAGFPAAAGDYLSAWMVELTSRPYLAWSETEIMRFLASRARLTLPPGLAPVLDRMAAAANKDVAEIIEYMDKQRKMESIMTNVTNEQDRIEVRNAGMLLLAPYLPLLLRRAGYLEKTGRQFCDADARTRAGFLLQYLVYGEQREWPETELFLNKVITGLTGNGKPLPRKVDLEKEDTEMADGLLEAVCRQWEKMNHTSLEAFRTSFLQRRGYVSYAERERVWKVYVEEKAYDVLLDSVPWGFKMLMVPWMPERIEVKWR